MGIKQLCGWTPPNKQIVGVKISLKVIRYRSPVKGTETRK